MILTEDVTEILSIINEASARLAVIIGQPVELQISKPVMPDLGPASSMVKRIDNEMLTIAITQLVCEQFMINSRGLKGKKRATEFVDARKITTLLLSKYIDGIAIKDIASLLNISRALVSYYLKSGSDLILTDKNFRFQYEQILIKIQRIIKHD
jgi:chromosomal replication initiation ATPase DnaA